MVNDALKSNIEAAWNDRALLNDPVHKEAVFTVIGGLNRGELRTAEPRGSEWQVNDWVKKGILLFFVIQKMAPLDAGVLEYFDKIPLKRRDEMPTVRVVPGAVVRTGTFIESGAILMPSFVNIGAWVGEGTMVDTWATVGSCAQVGRRVHLSGGVGIGGVLEPPQAAPVIIEDDAFIGSRCIVVEGVRVGARAVLGANVVLTSSTKIIDVSGDKAVEYTGVVPPDSVVIPGTRPKKFPAGDYGVPCALIIGKRKASTDQKTSLNNTLRDFEISV